MINLNHLTKEVIKKMTEKKFLTTKEVADRTGIPAGTLNNLAWKKEGPPFFKVGRKRIYEAAAVDDFIKANPVLTSDILHQN